MKTILRAGKYLLLFFFSLTISRKSFSQHLFFGNENAHIEVGVNFGPTFFLGDLGGNRGYGTKFIKDVNLELTKMMKGVFVGIYPSEFWGFRLAAQYTYVAGRDNLINTSGENELWRKQRNLDFRSDLWEAYGAIEIFPTMILFKNRWDVDYEPRIKPYGFIGLGVFHFDPEGSIATPNGGQTWHKLHPLRTEGQGMAEYPERRPYSLTQLNVPMGCGLRIGLSERVQTSLELLYRKTFTDYIDDVSTNYIDPDLFDKYLSAEEALVARQVHDKTVGIITPGINRYEPGTQRGNYKNMDAYFSFLLKIGVRLGGVMEGSSNRKARNSMKCPHFY
jgi:hypothetical protein